MYIKWCVCNRHILTTQQMLDKLPCDLCQKEHAQTLKDRLEAEQKKEEKDV